MSDWSSALSLVLERGRRNFEIEMSGGCTCEGKIDTRLCLPCDGAAVGEVVGTKVGDEVGSVVGAFVGLVDGAAVVGAVVGQLTFASRPASYTETAAVSQQLSTC